MSADYASVSGGSNNRASAIGASVSGGVSNSAIADHSSVSGGGATYFSAAPAIALRSGSLTVTGDRTTMIQAGYSITALEAISTVGGPARAR